MTGNVAETAARRAGSAEQPDPAPNDSVAVWDLVIADMKARDSVGLERYGTRLQPHNGRDALWDAYEELLDAAAYIRQRIYEIDNPQPQRETP